ncbi:hypothetical protein [Kocuria kalidii]|uniref:hypothetical protein n=1 Tax=Kocuria kalidii TaxID=3376283 RepID=UPI00379284D5
MSDPLHSVSRGGTSPVAAPHGTSPSSTVPGSAVPGGSVIGAPALGSSAMSVEEYARVVQARTEFVDFLLAPARGELAAAA